MHVEPKDKLEKGTLLKKFVKNPTTWQMNQAIRTRATDRHSSFRESPPRYDVERVAGSVLDENVLVGR